MSLRKKLKETNILTLVSQYINKNVIYVKENNIFNAKTKNKLEVPDSRQQKVSDPFIEQFIRFCYKIPAGIQNLIFTKS